MSKEKDSLIKQIFIGVTGTVIGAIIVPIATSAILPLLNFGKTPPKNDASLPIESPPPFRPPTGRYSAEGAMFHGSSRFIATVQDKTCIALVDGMASTDQGHSTVTVSRLLWRDKSFYINAIDRQLITLDRTSFNDGSRAVWKWMQSEISEPYKTLINDCFGSNDDKYQLRKVDEFHDSQSENSITNVSPSPSEVLKVQNFPDGDYFFASKPPSERFGDIFGFRKQGNIVVGFGVADYPSDGSCLRQEILSDSQVRTEKATTYIDNGKAQIKKEISTDDGSFWSSELSQVDVQHYTGFAGQIQACTDMFTN